MINQLVFHHAINELRATRRFCRCSCIIGTMDNNSFAFHHAYCQSVIIIHLVYLLTLKTYRLRVLIALA